MLLRPDGSEEVLEEGRIWPARQAFGRKLQKVVVHFIRFE